MLNLGKEGLKKIIKNNNGDLNRVTEFINISKETEENEIILELFEELNIEVRICSVCGKITLKGYCIEDGYEYACSDECLNKLLSAEQLEKSDSDWKLDIYYTEWTEVDDNGQAI